MTLFLISIYSYNYYDSIRPQPFTVQPHICGALFPTPAGRSLMKESIQFVDMSNVMLNQTLEHEENIQDLMDNANAQQAEDILDGIAEQMKDD